MSAPCACPLSTEPPPPSYAAETGGVSELRCGGAQPCAELLMRALQSPSLRANPPRTPALADWWACPGSRTERAARAATPTNAAAAAALARSRPGWGAAPAAAYNTSPCAAAGCLPVPCKPTLTLPLHVLQGIQAGQEALELQHCGAAAGAGGRRRNCGSRLRRRHHAAPATSPAGKRVQEAPAGAGRSWCGWRGC